MVYRQECPNIFSKFTTNTKPRTHSGGFLEVKGGSMQIMRMSMMYND